jgi:hypothetical protein
MRKARRRPMLVLRPRDDSEAGDSLPVRRELAYRRQLLRFKGRHRPVEQGIEDLVARPVVKPETRRPNRHRLAQRGQEEEPTCVIEVEVREDDIDRLDALEESRVGRQGGDAPCRHQRPAHARPCARARLSLRASAVGMNPPPPRSQASVRSSIISSTYCLDTKLMSYLLAAEGCRFDAFPIGRCAIDRPAAPLCHGLPDREGRSGLRARGRFSVNDARARHRPGAPAARVSRGGRSRADRRHRPRRRSLRLQNDPGLHRPCRRSVPGGSRAARAAPMGLGPVPNSGTKSSVRRRRSQRASSRVGGRNRRNAGSFLGTERRRSRTYPATGYAASPVLKTGWATGPGPLRRQR